MQFRPCCRVPVLRCAIKPQGKDWGKRVNICMEMNDGRKAVRLLQPYLDNMPPLRPIVLVIKAMLKVCHN